MRSLPIIPIAVIRGSGILWIEQLVRLAGGLVVTGYVARYLGVAEFGVLSYGISLFWLLSPLARLGLQDIVVRDMIRVAGEADTVLRASLLVRLLGGAIGAVVGVAWVLFADLSEAAKQTAIVLLLVLPLSALDTPGFRFLAAMRYSPIALGRLMGFVSASVCRLLLVGLAAPVVWFGLPFGIEAVVLGGAFAVYYRRHWPKTGRTGLSTIRFRALLCGAAPIFASMLLAEINLRAASLMLMSLAGPHEVGVLAAATRITELVLLASTTLIGVGYPVLVQAQLISQDRFLDCLTRLQFTVFWATCAMVVPLSVSSYFVIAIIYSPSFADAASVMALQLMYVPLSTFPIIRYFACNLVEAQSLTIYTTAFGVVVTLLLTWLLAPEFGASGVALAQLSGSAFSNVAAVLLPSRANNLVWAALKAPFSIDALRPATPP